MARSQQSTAGPSGPRAARAVAAAMSRAPTHRTAKAHSPQFTLFEEAPADTGQAIGPATRWQMLCTIEIQNFALLRRHLGVPRADRLVLDVAERASAHCTQLQIGITGRQAIDLQGDVDGLAAAEAIVNDLRHAFDQLFNLDGEQHMVDVAIAAAIAPALGADDLVLVEAAERALSVARAERRVVVTDLCHAGPAIDHAMLIQELDAAIERGEMFLQYQPKVHLRRQEVTGVEALVRWQHPTRGLILPGDFIPAAEDGRVIGKLTLWTLEQVIANQKHLSQCGHDLTVFVNILGQLLADTVFVAHACQLVRDGGAKIGFEITETSVIRDPQTAINHLQVFAEMNIPIAIDDYGAGLSSLAYLKQLPATELKIDKLFVVQLTSSNRDPLIVRSTIDLAHALDMEVTAEGVETQAALALLTVMGCDMVQGYLISRPISLDALVQYLDEQRYLAATASPKASFNGPASFWKRA